MTKIDISTQIELDDHELDERIVEAAAEQLLSQVNLTSRYGGAVVDQINAKLAEIVAARVEAMLDKEVAQVDRFGDLLPGKKTFREIFADQADAYLTERVNSDGRAASGGHGSIPRMEWLMRQVGAHSYEQMCRQVGEQFKKELQEKAKAALASVVASHVAKVA